MAVPWINFLAPSMGGIGPIEISDFNKLEELTDYNGVPFYAGRFYPKNSQAVFSGLELGLFSETPPWVIWEEIKSTQIWMVPAFEDERILTMNVTVERIDLWPRDAEEDGEYLPEYEETPYDEAIRVSAWGHGDDGRLYPNIDPGIILTNDVVPPVLFLGYVGISTIRGYVSEFPFYDQELTIINAPQYNMPDLEESDSELLHIRGDGVWRQNPAIIPKFGEPLVIDKKNGYPTFESGFKNTTPNASYDLLAISDEEFDAKRSGSPKWDELTKPRGSKRTVGTIAEVKSSQLDTVVITLKVSCTTVIIPDVLIPDDVATGLVEYGKVGLETFASNLSNNIWYFYWPVRYNGDFVPDRIQFLLNRTAVNEPGAFD